MNTENNHQSENQEATFRNGFWFFFNHKGHEIVVFCSAMSGKEIVYVDEEEVSNKRSLKMSTQHHIEIEGDSLCVEVRLMSLLSTDVQCTLLKDNDVIAKEQKSIPFKVGKHEMTGKKAILFYFACGFVGGLVGALSVNLL
jgi:hypothetical protein